MKQISFIGTHELIIDLFAGGGGASTAIKAAVGRPVDIAVNHDEDAVSQHKANHPETEHFVNDVFEVDPIEVTKGRPVGLIWASPDCKHFSKAKGGKPLSKKIRSLAWVVVQWAAKAKPRVIFLENVEEFKDWGPLTPDDKPCKKRKGHTFDRWKARLEALGYKVEHKELRACDYGAPTIRKRLFLVARRDGQPIVWPKPTHGPGTNKPYRTAAECIDWSIPCHSVFLTKEEARPLRLRRPLADATMRRIARGLKRYVIDAPDPFIVSYYGDKGANDFRGQELDQPLKTQTTENRFGLVAPYITPIAHYNGRDTTHDIAEPLRTITASPKGGSFALTTAFIAKHFGGATGVDIRKPFPTILARGTQNQLVSAHISRPFGQGVGSDVRSPVGTTTADGGGKSALVTSHMLKLRGTCKDGQDMREPAPTITAGGFHLAEVRAFLLKYYGTAVGQDLNDPMHTLTSKERMGLVTVAGEAYEIVDIGMRMLSPRELYLAQGFPPTYIIDRGADGKPLTKTAQVKMVGNSVSPYPAEALVAANVGCMNAVVAA